MFTTISKSTNQSSDPYISVVVLAFDRKEFIIAAIRSILSQTINRNKYEIIVVKNYLDPKIDKFLDENNILNIYTDEKLLGAKLAFGVKKSRGEVVSFLEDDDLYLPLKLDVIYDVFHQNAQVVYFRNEIIKTRSEQVIQIEMEKKALNLKNVNIFPRNSLNGLKDVVFLKREYQAGLNTSSTSIRKVNYLEYLKYMQNLMYLLDLSLFYFTFFMNDDSLCLAFEKTPLSIWRIHESLSNSGNHLAQDNQINKQFQNAKHCLDEMNIIVEISNKYLQKGKWSSLGEYLNKIRNSYNSEIKLMDGVGLSLNEIIDLVKVGLYHKSLRIIGSACFGIISHISPQISSTIFKRGLTHLSD